MDELPVPPTPTCYLSNNNMQQGGMPLASSSSSLSSSSGDSSSSSSSSSSSDEDEVGTNGNTNVGDDCFDGVFSTPKASSSKMTKGPNYPSSSKNGATSVPRLGKLVASGSVINDKIRVVPIEEQEITPANGAAKKGRGRGRPRKITTEVEKAELKKDPTIEFHVTKKKKTAPSVKNQDEIVVNHQTLPDTVNNVDDEINCKKNDTINLEENDRAYALHLVEQEEENQNRRFPKRSSTSNRVNNVNYLFSLQHEMMKQELNAKRSKSEGRSKKNSKRPKVEAQGMMTSLDNSSKQKTSGSKRKTSSVKKSSSHSKKLDDTKPSSSKNNLVSNHERMDRDASSTYLRFSGKTADWDCYLKAKNPDILHWISSVSKFPNAPLSEMWDDFAKPGTKVEIPNCFVHCSRPVYWIATIKFFAGYKALVQYETFGYGKPLFGWMSFCSYVPKPIGYCDANAILLFPPYDVNEENQDFLHLLRSIMDEFSLTTLRVDHLDMITSSIKSKQRYKLEDVVEAMDCTVAHTRRLGRVTGVIGDRVHVTYIGKEDTAKSSHLVPGFWFNVKSDLIRPVGWCQEVGMELLGVPKNAKFPSVDLTIMPPYPEDAYFRTGMAFEVIHPLHLNRIAAAKIEKVYKHGYFLAKLECNAPLIPIMMFVFHITCPWILPCGFCAMHNIKLAVPRGAREDNFKWDAYCSKKNVVKLDISPMLPRPANPFSTGEKFEAIDLRQPSFCNPVTVKKVAGHLLLLHFDGRPRQSAGALQWIDCTSPEIYPAGWAEMMGHEFQGHPEFPKIEDTPVKLI